VNATAEAETAVEATADSLLPEPIEKPSQPEPKLAPPKQPEPLPSQQRHILTGASFAFTPATIEAIEAGGKMTKLRQNITAIEVMQEVVKAGRKPTQAEQEVMALYAGFGGIKEIFNPYVREVEHKDRQKWLDAAKELRRLMGDEAFEAANRSTQNAHYTSPLIAQAMWRMAERMGFAGGRVIEPSMGSGNFLGLTPAHLREKTAFTGVELDTTTGGIATLLYPDANIKIQGFEDTQLPDNFYDMAIGNVPFGAYRVSDPRYNKYHASVHNYFFLKAVDKVRPGGLVMFITSTGTLDAPGAQNVRNALYEKADLVGAMRFPSATFKNALTAVVTDLVLLRKRLPGEKQRSDLWAQTEEVPNPAGGKPIQLNSYLALHRSQMLGEFNGNNRMHPGDANVDFTDDFEQRLEEAIERLPESVMSDRATALQAEMKEAGKSMKRNGYVVQDGELFRNVDGQLIKVEADARRIQRVEGMLKIRDVLIALTDAEMGRTEDSADTLRKELNTAYDRFAARYGAISDKANRDALEGDPELPRLMSLEDYDSTKKRATKRPIFFKATIVPPKRDAKPQNITEAVVKSLSLRGEIVLPMVAADLGISEEAAATELIGKGIAFQTPAGNWEIGGKYLSGNIRRKLGEARAAAENDPFFEANVKALEAVMPPDIPHTAISVQMGAPWIEASDISQFVAEMFKDSASSIKVFYDRATGAYQVEMEPSARARRSQETTTTWGTPQRPFQDLLDLALQGRAATVTKEVPAPTVADPYATRTVIDPEKTQAANTKLDAIKQRFREWVWEDDARRERLTKRYNEMFNSLRVAEYDSSFMGDQVPGMSPDWKLRPHQMAAVLRGITDRRGLMAHEVGLGKTMAMIATASELKRLGIAAKPAIAVPKKVLPGFARTARDAFPLMKLHVIDSRDAEKRQRTMSEIATGDFDLVLMTHDNLNMLRMRPEFEAGILRKELDEVNAVYDILRSEQRQAGGKGTKADARILATIKKRRENLAAKIKDALNTKLKDDAITFEAAGIDFLFVDEFHEYKSLPIVTALGQVKGVPTGDSQRSVNMMMRARYLQELQEGGGLIAATGTPVSNSLVEAYIMAKFLQPEVLEDAGIDAFDAWARNFAEVVSALEFDATGRWKPTSRMSKFKNLPELQTMSRVTLDVKTAKETGILQKRPQRKDLVITIPLDDTQKLFMRNLRERADRLKGGKVDPSVDNYLVVSNDGRLMSADIRMVLPGMENRPSAKIQALVENVTRIHKEKPGTTQMIFCDIGVQPNAWGFHLYGEIMDRLADVGIPKDRIIDFSKLDSDVKVEKAIERLRSGDAIIAIGHRKNMGTGVNAQDKMAAVHQFDTTWKPAMIEQSEARGWRQGNENPEIEILTYVVEGSFDATMWATVARKQQAIASFMRGAVTARELTEEDGEVLSYEQIAAAASGDQDYLRKAELEQRVFKLAMMKQAHDADGVNRRQAIPRIESGIAAKRRAAERYDDLAEWAKGVRERPAEYVSSEGKLYTDRADAAKALTLDIAVAQKRNKDAKIGDQERIYIGEYKGVRVRVEAFGDVRGVIPAYGRNYESDIFSINPNFENYVGTLQSFDQSLASIAANSEAKRLREVEIPSLDQDLANLRRIGETPFQYEEELTTAKTQLDRVSKRLAAKEQEAENAAEPLVAESGLDVRMTGQLGRRLRRGLREKELKPSDIPALLEGELARIKTETDIAKAEWAEYVMQKTEEQINLYGLEGVAMWEMAKSASRAQQAYGDLYAEQQAQADVGVSASMGERLKIDGISLEARKHAEDLVSRWTDFANDRTDFQTLVENSHVEYARDPQNPRAGIIYMNSHAYRLYELMLSEELNRAVSFPAMTTPGDDLIKHRIMLAKFERVARPEDAKAISAINDAIRQAQQDGVDGVVFFNVHLPSKYWDLALAHEGFHVWQYGAPETGAGWVERQPGYDRIRDELVARGYEDDPESITLEWATLAATDDLERFGFTQDEGARFLHAYFSEIIDQGGIDALDRVGNVSPRAQSIIETKRWRYARNQSRSQQQARTEAGGPGASPGPETSEITTGRGPTGARISLQGRPGNGWERGGRAPDAAEVRRDQPAGLTEALKPVRFEAGKRLTRGEKDEVLKSLGDSYKDLRAPKIEKGVNARGETIFGYEYNPDYMLVSDVTGRHIRYYVNLPDGRIAHPTELFPNLTKTEIDHYAAEREDAEKQQAARDRSRQNRIAIPEETVEGVSLKSHANAKYKATNRTLEGSYLAQDDQGRMARVDGKDAEDVTYYEAQGFKPANSASGSDPSSGFKTEPGFDGRPAFDASTPRLPFIEEALAAGASVDHISIQYHGSDWTVVSFENAEGTYLVKGEDVYVTQASVQEAQAAIEADPDALPGINDLKFAEDIEIRVSEIRSSENRIESRGRVVEHSMSM
jgi:N12 class adenine-specific DNA methylase